MATLIQPHSTFSSPSFSPFGLFFTLFLRCCGVFFSLLHNMSGCHTNTDSSQSMKTPPLPRYWHWGPEGSLSSSSQDGLDSHAWACPLAALVAGTVFPMFVPLLPEPRPPCLWSRGRSPYSCYCGLSSHPGKFLKSPRPIHDRVQHWPTYLVSVLVRTVPEDLSQANGVTLPFASSAPSPCPWDSDTTSGSLMSTHIRM